MEAFREFNGLRGLVIDDTPNDGKYRVAKVGGGIVYVTEKEYDNSKTVSILEVERAKLEVMEELYLDWEYISKEGNRELLGQVEKKLEKSWSRVFIDDEIVDAEEFRVIFNREIHFRTFGELMRAGYGFAVSKPGKGYLNLIIYKGLPMDEEFKRCSDKLKLAGLGGSDIEKHNEFVAEFDYFKRSLDKSKLIELNTKFYVGGVVTRRGLVPDFKSGMINHVYSVDVGGVPLTRELAIEIVDKLLEKKKKKKKY